MRRIAGFAGVFGLALLLAAGPAPAQERRPPRPPAYAADTMPQMPQPEAGGDSIAAFLQCRVDCGPKCDTTADLERNEHCKQLCERHCHDPDGN